MQRVSSNSTQEPARTISPWIIASIVSIAAFMELLDTTIVNVALNHIAGDLSSSSDEASWVLTSYMVANVIVLPLSGWFSRVLGRKRYFILSLLCFTGASVLCGLAPSLSWLVLFRVLQGLGGGGLQPLAQAILINTFPPEKRNAGQALFSISAIAAPAIGPVLGGILTDNLTWRWVFYVNIPVGIIAIILNLMLLPKESSVKASKGLKVDYIGLAFLALFLSCLQITLDRGQRDDWLHSHLIVLLVVGSIIGLTGLITYERRKAEPIVDMRLFNILPFALLSCCMFTMDFAFFAATYLIPLYTQQMLAYTATWSGLVLSPGAIVFVVLMPLMPRLIKVFGSRFMIISGFLVHAASMYVMACFDQQMSYTTVALGRIFETLGLALCFVPLNVLAFNFLPKDKVTAGSGLLNLARTFGGSCGISLAGALLARRSQMHQNMLVAHMTDADSAYRHVLNQATDLLVRKGISPIDASLHQSFALTARVMEGQATMLSFIDVFVSLSILSLLAVPLVLFVHQRHMPTTVTGNK